MPPHRRWPIIGAVSTTSTALTALHRFAPLRRSVPARAVGPLVALLVLLAGTIIASRISFGLFYAMAGAVLVTLGFLAYRFPRAMLIVVVFTPVLDRYLVSFIIPVSLHGITNYLSEALLLVVGLTIAVRGLREGTLLPALRHPMVAFLLAFVAVGAISAVVNGVPPLVAVAGLVFTLEAASLFVLPRIVGFRLRHALLAAGMFTAMGTIAAVLALGQVLIDPNFLGLESFTGRFNEGQRIAAFLVNPNMLGVVLAMAIPFPLLAAVRAPLPRQRLVALAVSLVLAVALFYTFSRGAWLGLLVAGLVVFLTLDWRAMVTLVLLAALSFALASVLPRHVLEPVPSDSGFDIGGATFGRLESLRDGSDLRLNFLRNAAPIVADHPVIGAGPGRYGGAVAWRFGTPLYNEYTAGSVPRDRTVDNFWLHIVVEFGVLGALLLAAALWLAVRQLLSVGRRAAAWPRIFLGAAAAMTVIVGMDSLAEMLLEGNTTSFAMWFFLGVGSAVASSLAARTRDAEGVGEPAA